MKYSEVYYYDDKNKLGICYIRPVRKNKNTGEWFDIIHFARALFGITGFGAWVHVITQNFAFSRRNTNNKDLAKLFMQMFRYTVSNVEDLKSFLSHHRNKPIIKNLSFQDFNMDTIKNAVKKYNDK